MRGKMMWPAPAAQDAEGLANVRDAHLQAHPWGLILPRFQKQNRARSKVSRIKRMKEEPAARNRRRQWQKMRQAVAWKQGGLL